MIASWRKQKDEVEGIMTRVLDNLDATISSQAGRSGATLRTAIGDVRANYQKMLFNGTFAAKFLSCFTAARQAGVSLRSLAVVHDGLLVETPTGDIGSAIVMSGLVFCLAAEIRMITEIEFVSRDDVDAMIKRMKTVFDAARLLAADVNDSTPYQKLTAMAGAITNYLANASRPLPRMVTFKMSQPLPALTLSQRVYYNAERWDELVQENKTVHPAFMQREIIGLSA